MPIYEYKCNSCGHRFEKIQSFSDSPIEKCEVCNGKVSKLLSKSTFHLKGSGWYATDYAKPLETKKKYDSKTNKVTDKKKD
ncbi:MAG TPA: zinc ribbon domain-containing protein [Nitrospinota bacterium]|nr:zinc ribbon domain-containing protein [Nitrospinota bacterium]